jgi:predicted permease
VITEVALALILLLSAGLCVRGLRQSRNIDLGLKPDGVLLVGLRVGMNGYTRETAPALYRTMQQRVAALPGVEAVGLADWFPLGFEDTGTNNVEITGQEQRAGQPLNFRRAIVSPGYFAAMGVPLVAGREFTEKDDLNAPRAVIVNEIMAARSWPGQDAIGRVFKNNGQSVTVVGVAKAGKYRRLNEAPEPFLFLPSTQSPWQLDLGLCVRTNGRDPATLVDPVRNEIHAIDPNVHVWQTLPLKDYIDAAVTPQKMASTLMLVLSTVALALAAMGVYAVMAYAVNQRRREIGIRMALGATPRHVLWHVSRTGLTLTLGGIAIGFAVSVWSTRLLASFLFGISPFDAMTFTFVPLLLAGIAALACYLPARRATLVDPVETLRSE